MEILSNLVAFSKNTNFTHMRFHEIILQLQPRFLIKMAFILNDFFVFSSSGGSGSNSGCGWYETAWPWKFARQKTSSWRVLEWWQIQEIIVEQCWIPINQDCWQQKNCLMCSRCLMVSTDQADPSCFYIRISWILIERHWFYFFCPLHLMQGLRSLEQTS